jgi:integrase/recombinase XerD
MHDHPFELAALRFVDRDGRGQHFARQLFEPVGLADCTGDVHEFHFRTHLFGTGVGGPETATNDVGSGPSLSNATIQQRLTALRLFYDYLVEQGTLQANPVGRGHHLLRRPVGELSVRGLVPRYSTLPWIPSKDEWSRLLQTARTLGSRDRFMFLFSYDCALRREELCSLCTSDFDPALRTVRIRGETTKSRSDRVLPFGQASAQLLNQYLQERHRLTRVSGRLLVSNSNRNAGQPITNWTWSKAVRDIALRAQVPKFSTHTFRYVLSLIMS